MRTLVSFCTLTSAPDYQLKPKRGSLRQLAFATIVDVLDPGSAGKPPVSMATAIDKVVDDEAGAAPHHMSRTLFFRSHGCTNTRTRRVRALERGLQSSQRV